MKILRSIPSFWPFGGHSNTDLEPESLEDAPSQYEDALSSLEEIIERVGEKLFGNVLRQLRRITLLEEQQLVSLKRLDGSLQFFHDRFNALVPKTEQVQDAAVIPEEEWIFLLDRLNKIRCALTPNNGLIKELLDQVLAKIYELAALRPIAREGERYDTLRCEIAGVVAGTEEGIVCEVIRQGYEREDSSCIRTALVTVSQGVTTGGITTVEEEQGYDQ